MVVEKLVPDVYSQHSLIDEATQPSRDIPYRLTISEDADSVDWRLALYREDGRQFRLMLSWESRILPRAELVGVIRQGLTLMLNA